MAEKLDPDIEKKYIESGGTFCPCCGKSNIELYDQDSAAEQGWYWEYIQCQSCGKS
jgi:hypothetical protein|tara:strand:+ start:8710 stop:8877 length:168 start_codon:yes stop_codon:yes gene_type:complete